MKSKRLLSLIMIIAVVALMVYTALFGIGTDSFGAPSVAEGMNYGLDIQGGVVIEFEAIIEEDAVNSEGEKLSDSEIYSLLEQTAAIMRIRIDSKGLLEPKVTVSHSNRRIRVEMPGVSDVNEAAAFIGTTAKVSFHLVDEGVSIVGADQNLSFEVKSGNIGINDFASRQLFDGASIKGAGSRFFETGYVVDLELDSDATKIFRDATTESIERPTGRAIIAIAVDGKVISAPYVDVVIPNGKCYINNLNKEEAVDLALQIKSGALPLELKEIRSSLIGPTLGQDALESSVKAGIVGFIFVILFMLFYYRLPGFIAGIALVLYATIVLFVMVGLNASLTLPGVLGLVLSLGMAVDANVVIFERLKEELRNGKTVRASIKAGFKRAMRTIMDANITTLIAVVVLYSFGEGPIKGFATTLGIGIIVSIFTAVVVTRTLLVTVEGLGIVKNRKFFGA